MATFTPMMASQNKTKERGIKMIDRIKKIETTIDALSSILFSMDWDYSEKEDGKLERVFKDTEKNALLLDLLEKRLGIK